MNDNALRAPQWRKLLGDFLPPLLGGTAGQWAEANRVTFPLLWADISSRLASFASHEEYQREYDLAWIRGMCEFVGVPAPGEARCREIATAAARFITSRARSDYPDAVPSVLALHRAGFELHTASGTRSWELEGILTAMGVRDCFGHLFGPDLVDVTKSGPEYYRRVFEQAGVDPIDAIVFDSSRAECEWATDAGARAIHVDRKDGTRGAAPDLATVAGWLLEGRF